MKSKFHVLQQIPSGVWVLGFVSLLMDISSEIIHSLLPLFMVSTLGISIITIGFIEGLAESLALVVKLFSGTLSDYLGKRKGITVFGYALSALTKPLFAAATSTGMVVAARLFDRTGKGIRGAPRDALVADLAPGRLRGASFGLRQSLDTLGALLGPVLAIALMYVFNNHIRLVFIIATIPAFLAVGLLTGCFHEPKHGHSQKLGTRIDRNKLAQLPRSYWWTVAIGGIFGLARFSEAFLLLLAQKSNIPIALIPAVLVVMNLLYTLTAYPFGKLSDQISHNKMLGSGLVMLIIADLIFATVNDWPAVLLGVACWGIHMGMTQGLLAAMVANTTPANLLGTGYGIFGLVSGVAMFTASMLAGILWDKAGASFTFYAGAIFCGLAFLGLAIQAQKS